MLLKTDKRQYFFEVQLNRLEGRKGMLTAKDVIGSIEVATPPSLREAYRICGAPNTCS